VGTPLRGIEFNAESDEAVSARVASDSQARIRIDAGGRITWTSGSTTTGKVELYRESNDLLLTPDVFQASSGIVTLTTDGTPTEALPDGAIAIDTTNDALYFRSGGSWTQVSAGGGGASLTVSDSAPEGPEQGDLWYDSTSGNTYVYYDSFWVQQSSLFNDATSISLNDLNGVTINAPTNAQVLKYNGTAWVNDAIDLSTDTTGNYVSDVTAGTGVTVTHTPSEGSSPTIAIGQAVGTTDNVQFNDVTVSGNLTVSGTTTTSAVPNFLVYLSGANGAASNGSTIAYNSELYDDLGNVSSGVFTVPSGQAGVYSFTVGCNVYNIGTSGYARVDISTTGSSGAYARGSQTPAQGATDVYSTASLIVKLAVGDTVSCKFAVPETGNYSAGITYNWFSGVRVR
jgi:hypothetical protein